MSVGSNADGVEVRSVGNSQAYYFYNHTFYCVTLESLNEGWICQFIGLLLSLCQVLKETALIEAFNLKADIEYQLKNCHNFTLLKFNLISLLFIIYSYLPNLNPRK